MSNLSSLPVLGYWNDRGRAEPIRLLLHYAGIEFFDKRYQCGPPPAYSKAEWLVERERLGLAAPNLPYWIEPDGVALTQTHAILMYLGEKAGLVGDSPAERARAMMAAEALWDWWRAFTAVTYCNAPAADNESGVHIAGAAQCCPTSPRFEALRKEYLDHTLPHHLGVASAMLRLHATGWIAGTERPTYADFMLSEIIEQHLVFAGGCLNGPALSPLRVFAEKFDDQAAVARYRRSKAFRAEPLHNIYSHFHTGWADGIAPVPEKGEYDEDARRLSTPWPLQRARDVLMMAILVCAIIGLVAASRTAIRFNELGAELEDELQDACNCSQADTD